MKIKRFVARDMKTALAEITEVLGADAVIMSNKKIPEGIEIMAAVDYNQQPSQSEPEVATLQESLSSREVQDDVVSIGTAPASATNQPKVKVEPTMPKVPDSLAALLNRDVQQGPKEPTIAPKLATETIEQQFKEFTELTEFTEFCEFSGHFGCLSS